LSGEIASAVSPFFFKNGGLIRILERITAKNWHLMHILGAKALGNKMYWRRKAERLQIQSGAS
jgi:hypothetical protein